ncbi:MAG: hypothetical protein RIC55_03085 [Pirellulaceae bacterium]
MTTRNALILGLFIFLGLVVSGQFHEQTILGHPLPADAKPASRFEMTTINTPHGDYVVVFDSTTGQCWSQVPAQVNDSWQNMGIPGKDPQQAE